MEELNKVINSGNQHLIMKTALLEIAKAEGAFKRNPLDHARSVIENMHNIAGTALLAIGEKFTPLE